MAAKISLELPGGLKMPALGLGTWQNKDEAALSLALEIGYRHIDTANAYENEKYIGNVLKKWLTSGKLKREDLFVTTKLPMMGIHPDRVEYFLKKSLQNLQLDYVDLYLVHFTVGYKYDESRGKVKRNEKGEYEFEPITDHVAVWKKMEEQVDAGRTKTIGLSNFNISQIENVLKSARIKPAVLQVELHVHLQQRALVDFCQKNGITVVAYAPVGSPAYNRGIKVFGAEDKELPDILGDPVVNKIAKKLSKTPAQIALRFLVQRGIVPIPKSATEKHIKENIDVFDFTLNDEDFKALTARERGEKARICDFKIFKGVEELPEYPFEK